MPKPFRPLFLPAALLLCAAGFGACAPAPPPAPLIEVKVTGQGKPLVFIPGLASPGSIWDGAVAEFSKTNTCYVVTVAGFGGAPPTAHHDYLLFDVRDAVIGYLRARKVEHPMIVGHSVGGVLALDLAATAPDLPRGLVLIDSFPFLAAVLSPGIKTEAEARQGAQSSGAHMASLTPEQFAATERQLIVPMVTDPARAAAVAEVMGRSDPATVGQAMAERLARDLRPDLAKIRCPVLVLCAMADKIKPDKPREAVVETFHSQYATLPQVRFEYFDQSRHYLMIDDPAGFAAALRKELDALDHG